MTLLDSVFYSLKPKSLLKFLDWLILKYLGFTSVSEYLIWDTKLSVWYRLRLKGFKWCSDFNSQITILPNLFIDGVVWGFYFKCFPHYVKKFSIKNVFLHFLNVILLPQNQLISWGGAFNTFKLFYSYFLKGCFWIS